MLVLVVAPASSGASMASIRSLGNGFPPFLPKEVERIMDPSARELAKRIQRIPVKISFSESSIMSSCVKPMQQNATMPVVLLHGFDSSCLEWRYAYPFLEDAGFETWAVDILGWGFSDLKTLPSCGVAAKREHLYQVASLVLIDASVYSEGTGKLSKLSRVIAYAGVSLLKSIPLRLYANIIAFNRAPLGRSFDWTNIGRLHCLLPWWEDATVDFMVSGGYDVRHQIKQVKQKTLILWGENDRIINAKLALRLNDELPDSVLHQIPDCGHLPHVEKPESVAESISRFIRGSAVS